MLINLFFSLSLLVSQLYTTDTLEFTVFNKTVLTIFSLWHFIAFYLVYFFKKVFGIFVRSFLLIGIKNLKGSEDE